MTVADYSTVRAADPQPTLKSVRATGTWNGGMATQVESRGFTFCTDEPVAVGGQNLHPTPMQYVVGAVNGCVSVLIATIATESGYQIRGIRTSSLARQDVRGFRGTADVSPHFADFVLEVDLDADVPAGRVGEFTTQVEQRCPAITLIRDAGVELTVDWSVSDSRVSA